MLGKKYYASLQCFIVGSAACGKGIANLALELVSKVHEAQPLVIAGDSSSPGFYRQLEKQNGRGYIHESEGSVISDVWRSSVATTTPRSARLPSTNLSPVTVRTTLPSSLVRSCRCFSQAPSANKSPCAEYRERLFLAVADVDCE